MNGEPTPDLDAFLAKVRGLPDGADVRVRLVHFETSRSKVRPQFWGLGFWKQGLLMREQGVAEYPCRLAGMCTVVFEQGFVVRAGAR